MLRGVKTGWGLNNIMVNRYDRVKDQTEMGMGTL